jgi:hypothetical protein
MGQHQHLLKARRGIPAVRSAPDEAWIRAQLDKRRAYVRSVAVELGIDPDEALRAVDAGGWSALEALGI